MATGVIFYPRSVGTAHHAYHRDNLPGGEEFEAKAANSFTLTDKPGRSNPVSIKATPYGISARRVANAVEFKSGANWHQSWNQPVPLRRFEPTP